jgi:hypothetical protein
VAPLATHVCRTFLHHIALGSTALCYVSRKPVVILRRWFESELHVYTAEQPIGTRCCTLYSPVFVVRFYLVAVRCGAQPLHHGAQSQSHLGRNPKRGDGIHGA